MNEDERALDAHRRWIGYLQPEGLVVTPRALFDAQHIVPDNVATEQEDYKRFLKEIPATAELESFKVLGDLRAFLLEFLGWPSSILVDGSTAGVEAVLKDFGETLRPTFAIKRAEEFDNPDAPWCLLIQEVSQGLSLDEDFGDESRGWRASPQAKFERLLRDTKVPTGLLSNGSELRLVYAPGGESSGHITFPVAAMAEVDGRPMLAGLRLLLTSEIVFTLPKERRLVGVLKASRRYQNDVSIKLAQQVLDSLYEMLRGFQSARDASDGRLLKQEIAEDPNHIYAGLLTAILRLIFVLYAEDRDLISNDPVYVRNYSVTGLFERLRDDAAKNPDTMNHRFGAWDGLLTLFRMLHDGAQHGDFKLPARRGHIFDPDKYPFLEGRAIGALRTMGEKIEPPSVPDGTVFRILEKLLILDGERISYRGLDVEQIGSIYETMMGFRLEIAQGPSVAIKSKKFHGAPTTINLEDILACAVAKRTQLFKELAEQDVVGEAKKGLEAASTVDELVEALRKKIASEATPNIVPKGAMILQPSDERRRSGSHYTPRSLTAPIVRTTITPIFERLGESPKPEQILELKICDPAMGSGAFLVEACRQLAEKLVSTWHAHKVMPKIPPDEDELLHARRLVAQRCLYGVDRNPLAADLAKLSLWLATLAKDHPFTFVDHALRHGDSLVGLTKDQIENFHWEKGSQIDSIALLIRERVADALKLRREIEETREEAVGDGFRMLLRDAEEAISKVRLLGNMVVLAFLSSENPKSREKNREIIFRGVEGGIKSREDFRRLLLLAETVEEGAPKVSPFHWEIEFPEVFSRENPGFDCIVGNPPFVKGSTISGSMGRPYLHWLTHSFEGFGGQADLVAIFFRRSFTYLRDGGTFGLVATKTISRGDTRAAGLEVIVNGDGKIYSAVRRLPWIGDAAVTVSIVWVLKRMTPMHIDLDGKQCAAVTSFLLSGGPNSAPASLNSNSALAFEGYKYSGEGFLFSDRGGDCETFQCMRDLTERDSKNATRIHPLMRGEAFLESPTQAPDRYVIDFEDFSEEKARQWSDLFEILERRVKPYRSTVNRERTRRLWWQFGEVRPGLRSASRNKTRLLMRPKISAFHIFGFIPGDVFISAPHVAIVSEEFADFAVLQSRAHEQWVAVFGGALEDRVCYTPSDCLENFPFPGSDKENLGLMGEQYHEFRRGLSARLGVGLTEIYNRFHDPSEVTPDIFKLRELHSELDRGVLKAYGWTDLNPEYSFVRDEADGWRFTWSEENGDEVLTRLLALNVKLAEEQLATAATQPTPIAKGKKLRLKRSNDSPNEPELR